jgi:hypothetical protein
VDRLETIMHSADPARLGAASRAAADEMARGAASLASAQPRRVCRVRRPVFVGSLAVGIGALGALGAWAGVNNVFTRADASSSTTIPVTALSAQGSCTLTLYVVPANGEPYRVPLDPSVTAGATRDEPLTAEVHDGSRATYDEAQFHAVANFVAAYDWTQVMAEYGPHPRTWRETVTAPDGTLINGSGGDYGNYDVALVDAVHDVMSANGFTIARRGVTTGASAIVAQSVSCDTRDESDGSGTQMAAINW